MKTVIVYTDGSCDNSLNESKPGSREGGYGIVISEPNGSTTEVGVGTFINTTSARMEIRPILAVVEHLSLRKNLSITIITDNRYCVDAYMKGWVFSWEKFNFQGKANADLWTEFLKYYWRLEANGSDLSIKWVKGHNGDPLNEKCDELANKARLEKISIIDDKQYWRKK